MTQISRPLAFSLTQDDKTKPLLFLENLFFCKFHPFLKNFFFSLLYQELFLFPRVDRKPFVTVIYIIILRADRDRISRPVYTFYLNLLRSRQFSLIRIFLSFLSMVRKIGRKNINDITYIRVGKDDIIPGKGWSHRVVFIVG